MNPTTRNLYLPWLSLSFLLLLVALAPYAMSFQPYDPSSVDSQQLSRIALVLLGLTATLAALLELIFSLRQTRRFHLLTIAPFAATFLACAVLGWRSYPYWATGVYQVRIGTFPPMDQDPKMLIPMIWIGELWRLPVLLLYPLCYLTVPVLALAVIKAIARHRFIAAGITTFCAAIAIVFMLNFSPNYVTWLMD